MLIVSNFNMCLFVKGDFDVIINEIRVFFRLNLVVLCFLFMLNMRSEFIVVIKMLLLML